LEIHPHPTSPEAPRANAHPLGLRDAFRPPTVLDVTSVAAARGFVARVGVSRVVEERVLRVHSQCLCPHCESVAAAEMRDRLERLLGALESAIAAAEDGAQEVPFLLDIPVRWPGPPGRRFAGLRARLVPLDDGPILLITMGDEVHEAPFAFRLGSASPGYGPAFFLATADGDAVRGERSHP